MRWQSILLLIFSCLIGPNIPLMQFWARIPRNHYTKLITNLMQFSAKVCKKLQNLLQAYTFGHNVLCIWRSKQRFCNSGWVHDINSQNGYANHQIEIQHSLNNDMSAGSFTSSMSIYQTDHPGIILFLETPRSKKYQVKKIRYSNIT